MSQPARTAITTLLVLCLAPPFAGATPPPFGTASLIADITPGPQGSHVRALLPTPNGAVFFVEPALSNGPLQLWASDGTASGTSLLAPDSLELPHAARFWYTERYVYFDGINRASGLPGIWRTDGSQGGTFELTPGMLFGTRARSLGDDGALVFLAGAPADAPNDVDLELWVSDGTPEGTTRLRDYLSTPFGVYGTFVEYEAAIYYLDTDPAETAIALWKTDGTTAGTALVRVLDDASFQEAWSTTSGLYLLARRGADLEYSLWKSDGSAAGTHQFLVLGRETGPFALVVRLLGELDKDHTLWALSGPSIQPSVWVSDGTSGGAHEILDLSESNSDSPLVGRFVGPIGGDNFFAANDGLNGLEIWRTDGTPEGTELAFETAPGAESDLVLFFDLGGKLYLTLQDEALGTEPWVTDGTFQELEFLGDLCPGPCSSNPFLFTPVAGGFLFLARDPAGRYQPWGTDLTAKGTLQIESFPGGVELESGPRPLVVGARTLLVADDGVHGAELWALPITGGDPLPPAGPWLSSDLVPGFEYKVRITGGAGPIAGSLEPTCIPETACVSGAVPGRSEVFVRVVGPRPNGYLWPTLVKFSTSEVEVWIRQLSAGVVRYYRLEGARPGFDELPGLFDRMGFEP